MNLTNLTNADGISGLGDFAVEATGGIFWLVIMLSLFIIMLIALRDRGVPRAAAGASFACLILSSFLVYMGWLVILFPVAMIVFLIGSLFYIRYSEQ